MKRCDDLGPLLSAYIDGEATSWERLRIEVHTRRCAACTRKLAAWTRIDRALVPSSAAPGHLSIGAGRRVARTRTVRLLVAIALAVGTTGGAITLLSDHARPTIDFPASPGPATIPPTRTSAPPTRQAAGPHGSRTATPPPAPGPTAGLACTRERNGGATDVGVTRDRIRLVTTTVQSGIGAAFLGEKKYAMEAVKNEVNRSGGICGRLLDIKYVDDGWDVSRGAQYYRNWMRDDVFAIAVGASSEGLNEVIESGELDQAKMPAVGTDGMRTSHYTHPWVWPVGVAGVSAARIMAHDAYARGAREFSIVFDRDYPWGEDVAESYNNEVKRLTGRPVKGYNTEHRCVASFCGIAAGQSSYATEVNGFEPGDFVAMFLEPQTALVWMSTASAPRPSSVPKGIGADQPLFSRSFAENCQSACDGMWVWTGYRPPIEGDHDDPVVRKYVSDLHDTKPTSDPSNWSNASAYLGMTVLVEALKRTGPLLTRERLRETLDSMSLADTLAVKPVLRWRPGDHLANRTMRAYEIQYRGAFAGWKFQRQHTDPHPVPRA